MKLYNFCNKKIFKVFIVIFFLICFVQVGGTIENKSLTNNQLMVMNDDLNIDKQITNSKIDEIKNDISIKSSNNELPFSYNSEQLLTNKNESHVKKVTTSIKDTIKLISEELLEFEQNNYDLQKVLAGKNLSIIGDSISTYEGYSNDYLNTNSTIKNNNICYYGNNLGITSVDQTWWKKTANETGMNLLVNNSYSGSRVTADYVRNNSAGYKRATQLHDDTGINAGTNPDIIAIYLGINDFNYGTTLGTYNEELYSKLIIDNYDGTYSYSTPNTFIEGYIIMLHKMINTYPDADIFSFTLVPNGTNTNYTRLDSFNNAIRTIANHYNVEIVDLYSDSGITIDNYLDYSIEASGLHPDQKGMIAIAKTFKEKLTSKYVR